MGWFYLVLTVGLEVSGTVCMKLANGFTRLLPSVLLFVFYMLSFVFMSFAVKEINLSVVYAIWSGVGTAAIVLIGYYYFNEPMSGLKLASIGLIVMGVIGLNYTG